MEMSELSDRLHELIYGFSIQDQVVAPISFNLNKNKFTYFSFKSHKYLDQRSHYVVKSAKNKCVCAFTNAGVGAEKSF